MTTILVLDCPVCGVPASEYVAILREHFPDAVAHYLKTTVEAFDAAMDTTIIASTSLPDEVLDTVDELRLFAGATAGYDHLPLEALRERNVRVISTFGVHSPDITEHVIG